MASSDQNNQQTATRDALMTRQQNEPALCANNCGFYGSSQTKNLCSKCYRDWLRSEAVTNNTATQQEVSSTSNDQAVDKDADMDEKVENNNIAIGSSVITDDKQQQQPEDLADNDDPSSSSSQVSSGNQKGLHATASEPCVSETKATEISSAPPSSNIETGVIPTQVDKSRCWKCQKKVGLLGFQCRCGFSFCGGHRYADTHNCGFDYKTFGRDQLSKLNQKVVAEKIQKI